MLDLENYKPNGTGHKCKECKFFFWQTNDHSPNHQLKCELKKRIKHYSLYGKVVEYGNVRANQSACLKFKTK